MKSPTVVYSVGHSTRSSAELIALLGEAGVRLLADVRRFPQSRRHPQHSRRALERSLARAGIRYVFLGDSLGGRQPARLAPEASPNRALTEPAFRHYADAMGTPAFESGLGRLCELAAGAPTAVLCAERVWWRCHRRLLADRLVVKGLEVVHLIEPGRRAPHALTEFARVVDGVVTYPALV